MATLLFPRLAFRFFEANPRSSAILVDELDASSSQSLLNKLKRFRITGKTTHFNIVDRVSMQTCRIREVPDSQIQRCTSHAYLCTCHRHLIVLLSHVLESQVSLSFLESDLMDTLANFKRSSFQDRRAFIGGSDARIIMGDDEAALFRLWREKRGE